MNTTKVFITGLIPVLAAFSPATAGKMETATETVDIQDAKRIVVECNFGAGELLVFAEDMPQAAELEVFYDPRRFDYDIEYYTRQEVGYLFLESHSRKKSISGDSDNEWNLALSTRYPMELELDIGACEADIDLGGLPLTSLKADIGAASGTINFSEPNPERLREIDIDIGASSVDIENLGNANFEYLSFSGGVASSKLDFRGKFRGKAEITLDVGLGSAEIILPEGVAVRIDTDDDSWLSSVDFHGDELEEVRDGVYETRGYEEAESSFDIELDVGLGSVDFYWK
jgi:hypothetical protein